MRRAPGLARVLKVYNIYFTRCKKTQQFHTTGQSRRVREEDSVSAATNSRSSAYSTGCYIPLSASLLPRARAVSHLARSPRDTSVERLAGNTMCTSAVASAVTSNLSSGAILSPRRRPAAPAAATMLGEQLEAREELRETDEDGGGSVDLEDRFDILNNLGSGAYATVYRARDRARGGEVVALKKVYAREDRDIGIPQFIMREVANLKRLSSPENRKDPHIVRLLDVQSKEGRYHDEHIYYLVFEHMDQDLDQFIRDCPSPGMNESVIRDFLAQILDGVDWMHVNNIVHRDLKPQNILVSSDGKKLKIADLGLSRSIGSNVVLSTQVVTQWYRAPEVLLHSSYNKPVDLWSVGCIFAEMIRGRALFAARRKGEKPQLEEIFSVIGTPTNAQWPVESSITVDQFVQFKAKPWLQLLPEASEDAQDLLSQMLEFQPPERVSAEDALHHPYITTTAPENGEGEEEEEEEEEGYKTPDSTQHTSSDSSPHLDISNSSDSGILPDSTSSCPS